MYKQYLQYVKDYFLQYGGYYHPDHRYNFRSKYEHTLRVLRWCQVLKEDIKPINEDILYTAALFHDVGYGESLDKSMHALKSACVFDEYAKQQHMDLQFSNTVSYLIRMHSNKELLSRLDTMPELIILMEADLLDEEGALRIIWYCATKAIQGADKYSDFKEFIQSGSDKRLINPMITPLAKSIWDEKNTLVNQFLEKLSTDIDINLPFLTDQS